MSDDNLVLANVESAYGPIRAIRGVARFGLLTAIGVPLLAAFGYSAAWRHLAPRFRQHAATAGLVLTVALSSFYVKQLIKEDS